MSRTEGPITLEERLIANQQSPEPFSRRDTAVLEQLVRIIDDPQLAPTLNDEANVMYRSSLSALGLSEKDVDTKATEFEDTPLTLVKIEAAYGIRLAADKLNPDRVDNKDPRALELLAKKR